MTDKMKDEWVKMIASKSFDSQHKFYLMIELLQDWRNRIEYLAADKREEEARPDQPKWTVHLVSCA